MGLQQRPKLEESLKEGLWGAGKFAFSNENWLGDGLNLFKQETGDLARDYWIGQPLFPESEMDFFNQAPAFWSCANKMMTFLLEREDFYEEHGIRPRSLKVTTISSLMGEFVKGKGILHNCQSEEITGTSRPKKWGESNRETLPISNFLSQNTHKNGEGG